MIKYVTISYQSNVYHIVKNDVEALCGMLIGDIDIHSDEPFPHKRLCKNCANSQKRADAARSRVAQ